RREAVCDPAEQNFHLMSAEVGREHRHRRASGKLPEWPAHPILRAVVVAERFRGQRENPRDPGDAVGFVQVQTLMLLHAMGQRAARNDPAVDVVLRKARHVLQGPEHADGKTLACAALELQVVADPATENLLAAEQLGYM